MSSFIKMLICTILIFPATKAYASDWAINISWFDNFNDPKLTSYILQALENNKDIAIARKNIQKYREQKNIEISKEFPQIDTGIDYLLLKVPKAAIPRNDIKTNSFAIPFIVNWELDFLGKQYDEIKKAKFDIDSYYQELKAANLIVATDTASAYLNISNIEKLISYRKNLTKIAKELYLRQKKMFEGGIISALQLNAAENLYLNSEVELENLYKQREIFVTELCRLLGKSPYNSDEIEVSPYQNIKMTYKIPESLKGSIVLNRPDILRLKNEIEKSRLDVLIATKDFFPEFNVTGVLGFSNVVGKFGWDSAVAGLIAGATQTLFDGGKKIFLRKKRKIEYEIALENYFNADLKALKEVNDALYALKSDSKILSDTAKMNDIENSTFVRVFKSYNIGQKSYLDYLNQDTSFISSQISLQNALNTSYMDFISLYKATGGAL